MPKPADPASAEDELFEKAGGARKGDPPVDDESSAPTRISHVPPHQERGDFVSTGSKDEIPLSRMAGDEIERTAPAAGGGSDDELSDPSRPLAPLDEPLDDDDGFGDERPPRRGGGFKLSPSALKALGIAAAAIVLIAAALAWRGHQRSEALSKGSAEAVDLLRKDTWAGYHDAARVLEPLVALDPLEAASMRAYALAMLAADYRDDAAGKTAEQLLVEPERAPQMPAWASLARAALGLASKQAGTAMGNASKAGDSPFANVMKARLILLGGEVQAALEPAAAAAKADPHYAGALALEGDLLRREKKFDSARDAYAAALALAPDHPRAAYGLAKLALAGKAPAEPAMAALQKLLDEKDTPPNERARAALHLAALEGRAGDRAGGNAAIDAAGLDPQARDWVLKAAGIEETTRGEYRAVEGAPAAVQSASDDDPAEAPPAPARVEKRSAAAPAHHAASAHRRAAKKVAKKKAKKRKKTAKRRRR